MITFSINICLNVSSDMAWSSLLLAWLRNQLSKSSEHSGLSTRQFHNVSTCSKLSPVRDTNKKIGPWDLCCFKETPLRKVGYDVIDK